MSRSSSREQEEYPCVFLVCEKRVNEQPPLRGLKGR